MSMLVGTETRSLWSRLPLVGRATPLHTALLVAVYLFFAVFLIWPIVQIVYTGFYRPADEAAGTPGAVTLQYLYTIFSDPQLVAGLRNSVTVAVLTTGLALLISLPLAVLSVRFDFAGRGLMTALLLVPLILPPFVGAIGMRQLLSRFGPLSQLLGYGEVGFDWLGTFRFAGIVLIQALGLYPIMLLNLQAALANIDPAMEQAAYNLGASRRRVFFRITLPLMRPGLFAGCTLVLIWSFTELGTPLMFDFYTITPVQVFKQITDVAGSPLPYALVVVMLAASTVLYLVGKVVLGRSISAATTKASVQATPRKLTGWQGVAALLPFVVVFALAVLPHLTVVLTSVTAVGGWYRELFPSEFTSTHYIEALRDNLAMPSVRNSVIYASLATLVACVVGLTIAVLLVRSNVPGKTALDSLAMLPLAVPGLVLAFGYLSISLFFTQRYPELTRPGGVLVWLNAREFPVVLLVLAYAARRLPYVVRSAVAGLQQTPQDLELAAANLGASRWTVMRRITIPLIVANLVAGALLAFAFAMLEVSDSLILAQQPVFYPITKAIWELSQRLGDGMYIASALGVWAMVLLGLTILGANQLLGQKMGAIFRA
ncbi:MAG: ABC transporter permease [Tepidisphaerales bacterium]